MECADHDISAERRSETETDGMAKRESREAEGVE
jgi:hypothetical protein